MLATGGVFVGISGKMSGAGGPPAAMDATRDVDIGGAVDPCRRRHLDASGGAARTCAGMATGAGSVTPGGRALAAAPVLVSLNPKVLAACAAAGVSVAAGAQTSLSQWADVTGFAWPRV